MALEQFLKRLGRNRNIPAPPVVDKATLVQSSDLLTTFPLPSPDGLPTRRDTDPSPENPLPHMEIRGLTVKFDGNTAVENVTLPIERGKITAFIGPSGVGKSTVLRTLNRMTDLAKKKSKVDVTGTVLLDGKDIYSPDVDPDRLRERVGMVFQAPNPFPKSIFNNVAYGLRIEGGDFRKDLREKVELALKRAHLWEEVKNRLNDSADGLSGGQQQRLCIARALAPEPEVLLLDEPTSKLDPIATQAVEEVLMDLRNSGTTIVIVTHNMNQAKRIADNVGVFLHQHDDKRGGGELVEFGHVENIFVNPQDPRTEEFIEGRLPGEAEDIEERPEISPVPVIKIEHLTAKYGRHKVIEDLNLDIRGGITVFMGPSGCGKTTLLRCLNRLHEETPSAKVEGSIKVNERTTGEPSYREILRGINPMVVRKGIGMIFQAPNPILTMSIADNVTIGPRLWGEVHGRQQLDEIIERNLRIVGLWDEVKDRLNMSPGFLSGGQQQRLCIARTLANNPYYILMDEPTSALDPRATFQIELLAREIAKYYPVIFVSHDMHQARRIADTVVFLKSGKIVEVGPASKIFSKPDKQETEDYITGKFE